MPKPSPGTQLPPIPAAACQAEPGIRRGEGLPQSRCLPQPRTRWEAPARRSSCLTFLRAAGSALLGALPSKKLRLLATPSEESRRLFWTGTEDFTPSERWEREGRQQGCAAPRGVKSKVQLLGHTLSPLGSATPRPSAAHSFPQWTMQHPQTPSKGPCS